MELFFAHEIAAGEVFLDQEESAHCVKVLRHRTGDEIDVIDGAGNLYHCRIQDAGAKETRALVLEKKEGWGAHPYNLTLACCPTKNNERFEWFVEKATEVGVDTIVPVIGEHSERKVYKTERAKRIALSATKQSLKAKLPEIPEAIGVKEFIRGRKDGLRLIAYCFEGETPRQSITEALSDYKGRDVTVLIGPEGDFSQAEAALALECGFIPIHLGPSRLRTETAAITAAEAVYFRYL